MAGEDPEVLLDHDPADLQLQLLDHVPVVVDQVLLPVVVTLGHGLAVAGEVGLGAVEDDTLQQGGPGLDDETVARFGDEHGEEGGGLGGRGGQHRVGMIAGDRRKL